MVVVEGATVRPFVTETSTMLVIGLVLSVAGIGFLCWLLFTLAVYALPFFAGLTAGLAAFHSGSGVIGALIVGVLVGGATWRSDRPSSRRWTPLIRAQSRSLRYAGRPSQATTRRLPRP
jgi:high-affinity Fe2+/Pb2+ permease